MPEVDSDDDSIMRWVVHHYRYDPRRRQRRHVLVNAFDNSKEFEQTIRDVKRQIEEGRPSGRSDPQERVTGTVWEPGHQARAATGHMVQRAVEHGTDPMMLLRSAELPSNMTLLQLGDVEQSNTD